MKRKDNTARIPTKAQRARQRATSPGVTFDHADTVEAWWDTVLAEGEPTGADTTTERDAWLVGRTAA